MKGPLRVDPIRELRFCDECGEPAVARISGKQLCQDHGAGAIAATLRGVMRA